MDIREFKNTYKEYAPSIIWDWCAKPTPEEIDMQLSSFSDMGIKSVYIRPSKGLAVPYLSENFFELVRTVARRSARYGIEIWIFDEDSPSSGNGGGEITSVKDYRLRDFVKASGNDVEKTDEVLSDSVVLRDMSSVRASKRIPLADITDSFVTQCFTEEVYDKYIRNCKRFIGYEIKGFVTNINIPEDSVVYSCEALKKVGSPDISKYGKKLVSGDKDTTCEYYRAFSDCITENYTSAVHNKCEEQNLNLAVSVCGKKAVSRQKQYVVSDNIALYVNSEEPDIMEFKLAESISAQFDKPLTIYFSTGKFAPCSSRFNKAAQLCAMGAGSICYDSVAFSLTDRRKYEENSLVLSSFSEKDISARISRFAKISSETKSSAKVLVICNSRSTDFFSGLSGHLAGQNVDFHIVEDDIFNGYARIGSDSINIGNMDYTTVIYEKDTITLPDSFGGRIIVLDTMLSPKNCSVIQESSFGLSADNLICTNRRKDGNNEYIFVTATNADTTVTVTDCSKKLFAADSSNGEIYEIPQSDGVYTFILKSNKTVLLICSDELSYDLMPPYTDELCLTPGVKICDIPFVLASAGENILPLKNVNACFGRKSYRENNIDNLHKEFYSLPDGETVKVKYPFTVDKEKIGTVKVYFENPENFDFVELNGKRIESFTPTDKDPRFSGTDITGFIADGRNTLAVEYKKCNNYNPDFSSFTPAHLYSFNTTTFEPVFLCGDFDVDGEKLTQFGEYTNDISSSGMPYYYGAITYGAKLPDSDLAGTNLAIYGSFDICKIKIGKREMTFYAEVPSMELFNLDSGTVAEITVFNTPYNLLRTTEEKAKPFGIDKIEICK